MNAPPSSNLEFGSTEPGGTTRYGFVVGIFATDHPAVIEEST